MIFEDCLPSHNFVFVVVRVIYSYSGLSLSWTLGGASIVGVLTTQLCR